MPLPLSAWRRAARRVVAIGECMIELSRDAHGALHEAFAGDTCNTAVYLARLLRRAPLPVHYATALGTDPFSEQMLAWWRAEGLHTDLVRRNPRRLPGLYRIDTDAAGERSFHYWRARSAARTLLGGGHRARLHQALAGPGTVYLSGITLAILPAADRDRLLASLAHARRCGAVIVFDSNYRPALWRGAQAARRACAAAVRLCDVALVGLEDEQRLFADADARASCARLAQAGVAEVVVRDAGGGGVVCAGARIRTPRATRVLDTTGAGDAFNAAYLAARLRGAPVAAAVHAGHALAARVIARRGAIIPRRATPTVEALLAGP